MPDQETGKQRAARIPLDYYRHADVLETWKLRLGALALVVTVAWAGTHAAFSEQRDFGASRGPVAAVHQTWNAQCSACHVDFTPISSHAWAAPFLGDPHESSQRCQSCHAGPAHHANMTPELNCGSCHRDHRGADASLVNLPDRDCTQCHQDLSKHLKSGKAIFAADVKRFDASRHPTFRSIEKDPGKLRFSHRRHLAPGMALQGDGQTGGAIQTLAKIPEPFRQRYRDQQAKKGDGDPVQLQCASCHQLDSGDFGAGAQAKEFRFTLLGQRNAGAYMLPISFENQCQACHPLSVERKVPADAKAGYLTIPHRLPPERIHDLLENFFTAQIARGQADFLDKKVTRPLPGKLPQMLEPSVRETIEKNVEFAEKDLYLSKRLCAECHYFEGKSIPEAINAGKAPDLRVAPTTVPQVWFQHAKFNHAAHRGVACLDCHGKAESSIDHADVLIPNRDNCVKCHAPTAETGTAGARHNCTECHAYHNGDHSVQGIGAAARNPETRRGIDGFLRAR